MAEIYEGVGRYGDDFDKMKDSEWRIMKATLGVDYASAMASGIADISGAMKAQDDLAFASKSLCDGLKSAIGIDYASAIAPGISSVLRTIKVPEYSALDHLDKTEHNPTNLKKIRNPELRLIKPNHSIREDLLLSIKNREDSISCKYICETLKLLPLCNDAAKIAKISEIFKPTNKAVDAILDLSLFVPRDKEDFGQFIDKLYTIFYEGAGDDKLRFLQENGGVLEESECEFIWCIKQLRNKWLRHDPDHGNEKKIIKSSQSLRDAFGWLGLNQIPTEPEDFVYMYSKLSKEARRFLECLLEKVKELS